MAPRRWLVSTLLLPTAASAFSVSQLRPWAHRPCSAPSAVATARHAAAGGATAVDAETQAELHGGNAAVLAACDAARVTPFFSLLSYDMLASCTHLRPEDETCSLTLCEILPELGRNLPSFLTMRDDSEWRFEIEAWAQREVPSEDYYDVSSNPERHTAYDGSLVWTLLHEEVCFPADVVEGGGWPAAFNALVSGLHTSIACHIAETWSGPDGEDEPAPSLEEYERRVAPHREALYFSYALLLRAAHAAAPLLDDFEFALGGDADNNAPEAMQALLAAPLLASPAVATATAPLCTDAPDALLRRALRQRSREVYRAMDCVGCGLCRLHGKTAWLGIAAALKVLHASPVALAENVAEPADLFGAGGAEGGVDDDEEFPLLSRAEAAALVVTVGKFADALRVVEEMETLAGRR